MDEKKGLISEADLKSALRINQKRGDIVAKSIMKIMGYEKLNNLYLDLQGANGDAFIDRFFEKMNLKIEFDEKDLNKIPASGSFITISNHPMGMIDGLILLKLIRNKRPDFKVMANFLLRSIEEISDCFIGINPFEDINDKSNFSGIKETLAHLSDKNGLGIFPAGEVSSYQTNARRITDPMWKEGAVKLIQKAGVPVIPIYFSGGNSLLFHLMGVINPKLRTAQLPNEMLRKRDAAFKVRIGTPIKPVTIASFENTQTLSRFLRSKTYSLGSALKVHTQLFKRRKIIRNKIEEITPEIDSKLITEELNNLDVKQKIISQQEFDIFIAYSNEIPNCLKEIGRLREITYRSVGEGTNKSSDLDEYDLYYHHLILWDREAQKIAGAYRVGKGNDINTKYGIRGFYTNSLFKFSPKFNEIMSKSLELGRSFIREEYQLKRLPLFLLWKGIMNFILNNPEYRYIIGPVSISGAYSKTSKKVMVALIKKHYYNEELAAMVKPRKRFRTKIKSQDVNDLVELMDNDLKQIDRLISDIEPLNFTLPVLLKKYINQNAKIISFNLDPDFNNTLDGLMILDLNELPEESYKDFG